MKKFMFIMIAAVAMACASCHTNPKATTSNKSDVDSLSTDSITVEKVLVDSVSVDSTVVAE